MPKGLKLKERQSFRYPDLSEAIETLQARSHSVEGRYAELLVKWLERLQKTQKEMRHLERIENFSSALKEKQQENDA